MAVALTVEDAMAVPDLVDADMTVYADTGAVEMTVADVVNAHQIHPPQTHTPSTPTNALTRTPLTTSNPA